MKILQLLAGYDSAGLFGSITPLISELRRRGHDVQEAFVPLRTKQIKDVVYSAERMASVSPQIRASDVVHVHTPTVHLMAATTGIVPDNVALVSSRHATGVPRGEDWRRAYKRTDIIVPVARYLVQEFYDAGAPAGKLFPVHNGVNLVDYEGDRTEAKKKLGISPDTVVVGWTGRLSWVKNLRNTFGATAAAIKAAKRPAVFLVAGAGKEGGRLAALVKENGWESKVRMLGFLKRPELLEFLPALDIAVHYSWTEACSVSLIEYLASGAAVIVSPVPGNKEVVGKSGLVVEMTPPALSSGIRILIDDEIYRRKMQAAARDRARMFDVSVTASKMEMAYQMAVERRCGAGA